MIDSIRGSVPLVNKLPTFFIKKEILAIYALVIGFPEGRECQVRVLLTVQRTKIKF